MVSISPVAWPSSYDVKLPMNKIMEGRYAGSVSDNRRNRILSLPRD